MSQAPTRPVAGIQAPLTQVWGTQAMMTEPPSASQISSWSFKHRAASGAQLETASTDASAESVRARSVDASEPSNELSAEASLATSCVVSATTSPGPSLDASGLVDVGT